MTTRFFRGIQAKLVGLYLMLTILSIVSLTALFYQATGKIISTSIRAHLQTIAKGKTDLILRWMEEREHDVEVLAKNATVTKHVSHLIGPSARLADDQRELAALLRIVRDQYQAYHDIIAFDVDGTVLVSTSDKMSSSEVLDPGMLRDIREGRRHISELGQLKSSSSLSINIAAPIVVADGSVLGGILAKVNLEIINQMTDSMALMQSGEAYLVDRRGVFVTHRDRRRVFRDNISKVPGVKQVISGRSGVDEYPDYRGISVLGGYQWLPRWQWGLLVEVDSEEAYEPLYSARRFLIVIALLVAAAVFLGTFLIARRIVHPLRELTAAVKAMAAGSFQQRLAIAGGDEIAYLSESFNQMAANISQNHTELRARVQRATRDLEAKNERLEKANQDLFTANRKLEQQAAMLMRSAKLAALGEMAAGLAHEINNPLTTIKNLVQISKDGPNDIRPKDLEVLAEEVDRISRLVLSFLNYAKPRPSRAAFVDIAEVVSKVVDLMRSQIKDKAIELTKRIDRSAPKIQADGEQLEQVMVNLLLNAIQASPVGAEVKVFVRTAHSDVPTTPTSIQLGVVDRGPGIVPKNRPKVFSPFFTTKENGFGLGLAMSQRIVQDLGGEICFTSEPSEGTTFTVSLPVKEESGDEPDPDS